jgi:hypothetical protein
MMINLAAISTPLVRNKDMIGILGMLHFAVLRKTERFTVIDKNNTNSIDNQILQKDKELPIR